MFKIHDKIIQITSRCFLDVLRIFVLFGSHPRIARTGHILPKWCDKITTLGLHGDPRVGSLSWPGLPIYRWKWDSCPGFISVQRARCANCFACDVSLWAFGRHCRCCCRCLFVPRVYITPRCTSRLLTKTDIHVPHYRTSTSYTAKKKRRNQRRPISRTSVLVTSRRHRWVARIVFLDFLRN